MEQMSTARLKENCSGCRPEHGSLISIRGWGIQTEPIIALGGRLAVTTATLALVACLLAVLALAASATAAGEFEPNDSRDSAFGPLAGGVDYTARFETDNDVDWYVFYVRAYGQFDFSATSIDSDCPSNWASVELKDLDGKWLDSFDPGSVNETNHLYLTLNPGRYYLLVDSFRDKCTTDRYRFRIDPAAAITTSVECGEAIVAREAIAPQLATISQNLAKNAEDLAEKAAAVHAAKKELRRDSKQAQRLKTKRKRLGQKLEKFKKTYKELKRFRKGRRMIRKLNRTSAKLRQARTDVKDARRQVQDAKAERRPLWKKKLSLDAVAQQHQRALSNLNGQTANHC